MIKLYGIDPTTADATVLKLLPPALHPGWYQAQTWQPRWKPASSDPNHATLEPELRDTLAGIKPIIWQVYQKHARIGQAAGLRFALATKIMGILYTETTKPIAQVATYAHIRFRNRKLSEYVVGICCGYPKIEVIHFCNQPWYYVSRKRET